MAEKELSFLKFITEASQAQVKLILHHITSSQLDAIGEVCYNLQYGAVDVEGLRSYRRIIRILGDKQTSPTQRRRIVRQRAVAGVKIVQATLP